MQTPPRGQKVWARLLKTAGPPSCEIFSPRRIFGKLLRVPRSLTGAVMNFLLPRGPRIARGGECAGAPPVAEKATKHSSARRCRRKQKRRGDGLPRRWARCAGAKKQNAALPGPKDCA
nr:MAG TPA: hypothetical protein [Caudoviricetes sp.]